jgi:hypothetical protein
MLGRDLPITGNIYLAPGKPRYYRIPIGNETALALQELETMAKAGR